jgi:hypothetical protein
MVIWAFLARTMQHIVLERAALLQSLEDLAETCRSEKRFKRKGGETETEGGKEEKKERGREKKEI